MLIAQTEIVSIPQRVVKVRSTTCVRNVNGSQHEFFVGVCVEVETNVDAVGERDESHLEAVGRLSGADRQRMNDGADELYDAPEVLTLNAARRVQREHDVRRRLITACDSSPQRNASSRFVRPRMYGMLLATSGSDPAVHCNFTT